METERVHLFFKSSGFALRNRDQTGKIVPRRACTVNRHNAFVITFVQWICARRVFLLTFLAQLATIPSFSRREVP